MPQLATIVAPLRRLLYQYVQWSQNQKCEEAFKKVEELFTSLRVLAQYDLKEPLQLPCDASSYGFVEKRTAEPVAYTSDTLTSPEKKYSPLWKESLALLLELRSFMLTSFFASSVSASNHF